MLSSSSVGDNISCFCSLLYFSLHDLSSPLPFRTSPPVSIPSFSCWLSSFLTRMLSVCLRLIIQSHHPIQYHNTAFFIHVLSPLSSMTRHFILICIMQLLILYFPFSNRRLFRMMIFSMGDLV